MLDADDIAEMRATLDESLPDTAAVTRRIDASDGAGGATTTWSTVTETLCRIGPVSARDQRIVGATIAALANYTLTVTAGTDVRAADRIAVGARTFAVKAVLRRGEWNLATRAVCAEVH